MKMLVKTVLAVSLALPLGNAHAEYAYYACDVIHAGTNSNGSNFIQLSCPDIGTPTWHVLEPKLESKGLAIGMAAIALGQTVAARIDPDVPYSYIHAIYLKKN